MAKYPGCYTTDDVCNKEIVVWKKTSEGYESKDGRFLIRPAEDKMYGNYILHDHTKPMDFVSCGLMYAGSIAEAKKMADKRVLNEKANGKS